MALTFDAATLTIESSASITDLPAFHAALRDWEDSEAAAIYPVTHTWKALDLGSGAYFYQCDLVNSWKLKFPAPGNYTITGNLNATITPVAGVFVDRTKSAAFATVAGTGGGSGPTASEISAAVGAEVVEGSFTRDQILRIMAAALAGTSNKAGNTITFKGLDGTTDRIAGSFDAESNRTGATLNGS